MGSRPSASLWSDYPVYTIAYIGPLSRLICQWGVMKSDCRVCRRQYYLINRLGRILIAYIRPIEVQRPKFSF